MNAPLVTRLRWDQGRLYFELQSRPCPDAEIVELERELRQQLTDASWKREAIVAAGKRLWSWLDGSVAWLQSVQQTRAAGRPWQLEIAGTHGALAHLPWETLHDGRELLAAARPAFVPVRRADEALAPLRVEAPSEQGLSVLFMASAPESQRPLLFEAEEARILDATRNANDILLMVEESGTLAGLTGRVADLDAWSVVHLTCHGKVKFPEVLLETDTGTEHRVTPTELLNAFGSHGVRAVFASACDSATWDPDAKTSFADALVRGGAKTALGFASKVLDESATRVGAELHQRLARGESLAWAVADVRRERANDPAFDPGAWASWRCFTRVEPSAMVVPASHRKAWRLRRRPDPGAFLRARGRSVPVASMARFVGRRRALQRLLRAITGRDGLGAAVIGIGGAGKSSLVLRALTRVSHRPVVLHKVFSRGELLLALRECCAGLPDVVAALSDEEVKRACGDEWAYRALVQRVLELDTLRDHPLVFVFDDAESELEDDTDRGVKRLRREPKETLSALMNVLWAVPDGRCRVVITSRHAFEIPDRRGADLFPELTRVELAGMTDVDAAKLLWQADRYDERGTPRGARHRPIATELKTRCHKAGAENPRLLTLLHVVLAEDTKRGEALLGEVERYLHEGHPPGDAKAVEYLEGLALGALLTLAGEQARDVLRALSVFPIGLPVSLAARTAGVTEDVIERLVDLSLLERDESALVRVPLLVRPATGVVTPEARKEVLRRFFNTLPKDWQPDAKGDWSGPLDRAVCLFEFAGEVDPPAKVVGHAAGEFFVRRLVDSGAYEEARAASPYADRL